MYRLSACDINLIDCLPFPLLYWNACLVYITLPFIQNMYACSTPISYIVRCENPCYENHVSTPSHLGVFLPLHVLKTYLFHRGTFVYANDIIRIPNIGIGIGVFFLKVWTFMTLMECTFKIRRFGDGILII